MKRKYEGLIVLNTKGREDTVDTIVSKLGRDMELEGITLEQIDHLGKKKFPYGSKKLDEGYYVNYLFSSEPAALDKIRAKLRLNADVHQQHYQRLA
ncbi:MAG: 30S ribosomal protein S6 [Verrucomicrobiaceae bacterium]|nr:MAG: 30S ribosomal protein S6 [Verrucomicrobiaceae bacterium]